MLNDYLLTAEFLSFSAISSPINIGWFAIVIIYWMKSITSMKNKARIKYTIALSNRSHIFEVFLTLVFWIFSIFFDDSDLKMLKSALYSVLMGLIYSRNRIKVWSTWRMSKMIRFSFGRLFERSCTTSRKAYWKTIQSKAEIVNHVKLYRSKSVFAVISARGSNFGVWIIRYKDDTIWIKTFWQTELKIVVHGPQD